MPLRLYAPSRRKGQEPALPGREPLPLHLMHLEHDGPDGPYVDTMIAWENEDGARCRYCPPGSCTFAPGARGVGACTVRRPGTLEVAPPLPLSRGG